MYTVILTNNIYESFSFKICRYFVLGFNGINLYKMNPLHLLKQSYFWTVFEIYERKLIVRWQTWLEFTNTYYIGLDLISTSTTIQLVQESTTIVLSKVSVSSSSSFMSYESQYLPMINRIELGRYLSSFSCKHCLKTQCVASPIIPLLYELLLVRLS